MKTDILLISIQKDLDVIGLKSLHYFLLENSYHSSLLFLPDLQERDEPPEQIISFVREKSPSVIGLSLMSIEYGKARYLTGYLKNYFPHIPIIWGGIHTSLSPEECLRHADYICIGEGERTLLDVMREVKSGNTGLKHIHNLGYKESGRIKQNPLYPLIDNLDSLPAYEHFPRQSYIQSAKKIIPLTKRLFRKFARYAGTTYSIMTSRGCPFSCSYCCNNVLHRLYGSKKVRRRSVAHFMDEIERAVCDNPYIKYINFYDDCFLLNSEEYLQEFCLRYRQNVGIPFIVRSIPVFITREKMQILKNAGIGWITLGLQSGSERTCRDIYQRNSLKSDFLKAAQTIKDYGIAAFYDVILDNPFESEEDRLETINTLLETPKPFYTQFFSLTFYPGTELFERATREFPEKIENADEKNYFSYKKTVLNDMTRIATFIGKAQVKKIIRIYKTNPDSFVLKLYLTIAKLKSALLFEPLTYLKIIHLSHGNGILKTLGLLPYYFNEGISRYIEQFRQK